MQRQRVKWGPGEDALLASKMRAALQARGVPLELGGKKEKKKKMRRRESSKVVDNGGLFGSSAEEEEGQRSGDGQSSSASEEELDSDDDAAVLRRSADFQRLLSGEAWEKREACDTRHDRRLRLQREKRAAELLGASSAADSEGLGDALFPLVEGLFGEVATEIPGRAVSAVRQRAIALFRDVKTGPLTEEEALALYTFVEENGRQWAKAGRQLQRHAIMLRDHYERVFIADAKGYAEGPWTDKEKDRLKKAVGAIIAAEKRKKGNQQAATASLGDNSAESPAEDISFVDLSLASGRWSEVSKEVKTRGLIQCWAKYWTQRGPSSLMPNLPSVRRARPSKNPRTNAVGNWKPRDDRSLLKALRQSISAEVASSSLTAVNWKFVRDSMDNGTRWTPFQLQAALLRLRRNCRRRGVALKDFPLGGALDVLEAQFNREKKLAHANGAGGTKFSEVALDQAISATMETVSSSGQVSSRDLIKGVAERLKTHRTADFRAAVKRRFHKLLQSGQLESEERPKKRHRA